MRTQRALVPLACLAFVALSACEQKTPAPASTASSTSAAPFASTAAPAPTSPFRVVATELADPRLFTLGDSVFLSSAWLLYALDDKGVHQDVGLHKGFKGALEYEQPVFIEENVARYHLMGSWPDAAWLQAWGRLGDQGEISPRVYRWVKDRWRMVDVLEQGEVLCDVSGWRKGSALALISSSTGARLRLGNNKGFLGVQLTKTPWAVEDNAEADSAAPVASASGGLPSPAAPAVSGAVAVSAPPPSAEPAAPEAAEPGEVNKACQTELRADARTGERALSSPHGIIAFDSGHVFVAGSSCADNDATWVVERFGPTSKKGELDRIPRLGAGIGDSLRFAGRSPTDVYLYSTGKSGLRHWDGKAWTAVQLPNTDPIAQVQVSTQGTVWAIVGSTLYKRATGERWEAVELPAVRDDKPVVEQLAVPKDDVVWIVASGTLLSNASSLPPVKLPGFEEARKAAGTSADLHRGNTIVRFPASPVCEQPYVLLLEHVPAAKKEFPAVAERLRGKDGITGVELSTETSQKWTFLGATVPSIEVGQKVVEAMKGYPDSVAALYCHVPKVGKKIPLEGK
jgi:hypothetical protein